MEPPNQEGRAPWILPVKLNKISSGQRFSKYRHLDESRFFLLQKRKRPFRSQRNPTFRIITNQHPFYEVANADDLNLLRAKCWGCIINDLPTMMQHLSPTQRRKWLIAHITTIVLANTPDKDGDLEDGSSASANAANIKPSSPLRLASGSLPSPRSKQKSARLLRARSAAAGVGLDSLDKGGSGYGGQLGRHTSLQPLAHPPVQVKGLGWWLVSVLFWAFSLVLGRDGSPQATSLLFVAGATFLFMLIFIGDPVRLQFQVARKSAKSSDSIKAGGHQAGGFQQGSDNGFGLFTSPNSSTSSTASAGGNRTRRLSAFLSSGEETQGMSDEDVGVDEESVSTSDDSSEDVASHSRADDSKSDGDKERGPTMEPPQHSKKMDIGCTVRVLPEGEKHDDKAQRRGEIVATWTRAKAETFRCRVGPNYKRNKKKDFSGSALYECVGFDVYRTGSRKMHIAQYYNLPNKFEDLPAAVRGQDEAADGELKDEGVPEQNSFNSVPMYIVANFQVPAYAPEYPWGTKIEDGEGMSAVQFFKLKNSVRKQLMSEDEMEKSAALRLLRNFMMASVGDKTLLRRRMKCIAKVVNVNTLDVGGAIKRIMGSYNAKPFMTGPRCHTFFQGENYLEIDINVHDFCYLARKGVKSMVGDIKKFIVDLGLVVQGQEDNELPEQMLGVGQIGHADWAKAFRFEEAVERRGKDILKPKGAEPTTQGGQ